MIPHPPPAPSPADDDLRRRPALELAGLLRRREISSQELVTRCLERIAARNERLQAFVSVFWRSACRAAAEKDRLARRGEPAALPLFSGVPIGVKDINLVRGAFVRMGSRAFTWLGARWTT